MVEAEYRNVRRVFVTAGGRKWHEREDCEALIQGQQEARDRGWRSHVVRQLPLFEVAGRQPCGCCVRPCPVPISHLAADTIRRLRTDTPVESIFRDEVLATLPDLWGWVIESQHPVVVGGISYRFDFTITDGPHRVAVEIDGENKGPNAASFDERTRRQTLLTADGWEVLHFTNRQAQHEQEQCRRQIAVVVARIRERHRHSVGTPGNVGHEVRGGHTTAKVSPGATTSRMPDRDGRRANGKRVAVAAVLLGAATVLALQILGDEEGIAPSTSDSGFVSCPESHPIKGNIADDSERIFHVPDGAFYDDTRPERCFTAADEAEAAGYRASQL